MFNCFGMSTRAAGMIFIPCASGISHNEAESATESDMANGARLLVKTLLQLAV